MTVEGDGGGGLELLAVEGGEDTDDIVGAGARLYDTSAIKVSDERLDWW